jgi:WD40 repeat protein
MLLFVLTISPAAAATEAQTTPGAGAAELGGNPQMAIDRYGDAIPRGAVARLGSVRLSPGAPIAAVAFARDGKKVATASFDTTDVVSIWDTDTGRLERALRANKGPHDEPLFMTLALAFDPGGKQLAACGSKDVVIWELATGRMIRVLRGHEEGGHFYPTYSADGRTMATVGPDRTVYVWDVRRRSPMQAHHLSDAPLGPIFLSPDGSLVAAGFQDGTIRLHDTATGNEVRRLQCSGLTFSIAFSGDGRTMTSLGTDGELTVWDVATGKVASRVKLEAAAPGPALASADLKTVVSVPEDGPLRVWDSATRKQLRIIKFDEPRSQVHTGALSLDGRTIALASWRDSTLRLWDVCSGLEKFPHPRHAAAVRSVAFTRDDRMIVSGGDDCTIRLWEVSTGREVRRILDGPPQIWELPIGQRERDKMLTDVGPTGEVRLSNDEKTAISAGVDGSLRFWDLATGKAVRRIKLERAGKIRAVGFAPACKAIAASFDDDRTLALWDTNTGRAIRRVETSEDGAFHISFSSDGRTIATTGFAGAVSLWQAPTLHLLRRSIASPRSLICVAFSPGGDAICAGGSDGGILLMRLESGKIQRSPRLAAMDKSTLSVAFSADGRLACYSGEDGFVRIWDIRKYREVAEFRGCQGTVYHVVFSHNSRFLASAGADGTVLVWDLAQLRE